ncbi:hypothetical protein MUG87_06545 [Ectobacillus sp. JY-23]|uniref:hypothetical protein n=1 Tax=Ectobacillus sp. JY-23 TaxID=2933872 RepID=UPI001FF40C9F|nr:hypothetical protein [Ectobacillus sp. JY-23]UOY93773.1 hypothetical protein MUG87_06545 [Ectobacillus sp. JY-23]
MQKGLFAGTIAGIVLGLSLKFMQALTGSKVYTLLLNVDFIPYMNQQWSEATEFSFHLIISLLIGMVLHILANRGWHPWQTAYLLTLPTIFLYFPLTVLAIKDVPAPNDWFAFSLWIIGHMLYAISLAYTYSKR